jgi:hypothetical protein
MLTMAFACIGLLVTAPLAGAQSNPCTPLNAAGVDCDFVEVGLFAVRDDDEIAIRSDPVRLRGGFHAVACCGDSSTDYELELVTVLENDEEVESSELVDGCLGYVFPSVSAMDDAVRDSENTPEMVTLRLDDASETKTLVELRALRSVSPSSELCRTLPRVLLDNDRVGSAFIIFFDDGADE